MPALPSNSLIAITGITGYIASNIGLLTLKAGHRVRGTIRSWARVETLKAAYEKHGIPAAELDKRLEFVVVDDLQSEEQWTKALKDVDGVVHSALGIVNFTDPKVVNDVVEELLSLLRSAKKYPSIKRVVYTSSIFAAITFPMFKDKILTTEDYNDEVVDIIEKNLPVDHDPILKQAASFFPYSAGKVKAEKAAWEFVKQTSFDFVAILPATNAGPLLHETTSRPTTAHWFISPLKNDTTMTKFVSNQWFVDVRDCARLHLLALTTPSMGGKRFYAAAEPWGWNQVFGIHRKNFPSVDIPEDIEGGETSTQKVDNSASTELLGGWISLEQSLVELGKSFGY